MKRNRFTDEQKVAALRDAEATTVIEIHFGIHYGIP